MNYNLSAIREDCSHLVERIDTKKLKGTTVLVTGANGLIGGFLCDFLCFLNDHCGYGMNLVFTSKSEKENAQRISHLVAREDVTYFSWDCSVSLESLPLSEDVNYLFFCSGYGQPRKFLSDKIRTMLVNIVGIESLLKVVARQEKKCHVLFLSTSEIYGDVPESAVPTSEDYKGVCDVENNRACYILAKATAEVVCQEYFASNKVNGKVARVALVYGPGSFRDDARVMQDFILKAHEHKEIQMMDEGQSLRNYLYISDCAEILINCLLHGTQSVYNVGGDSETISIYNLAKKIAANFEVPVRKGKVAKEFIKNAPKRVGLSMSRYRKEFPLYGAHITGLKKGIENVLRWYNFKNFNS